jgi:hypothetical protein
MPKISVIPRGNKYFRLFDYYRKVVLKLPLLTLRANNYGIGLVINILGKALRREGSYKIGN